MAYKRPFRCALLVVLMTATPVAFAVPQFTFDFNSNPDAIAFIGGNYPSGGGLNGNDGTRLIQEKVSIGGTDYMHLVIGQTSSGFVQESYITALLATPFGGRPFSPDSGGNERALIGDQATLDLSGSNIKLQPGRLFGNAKDPFGVTVDPASGFSPYDLSGNGTGNPTRATLRTVVSDGEMSMEVFKPMLERKPLVTQEINDGEISVDYQSDTRAIGYSDLNRAGTVSNRTSVNAPDMPSAGAADFDMSMTQRSLVTAGQYSYSAGAGWSAPSDPSGSGGWDVDGSTFDEGTYTYVDGNGFDVYAVDWSGFFNYSQNAAKCNTGHRVYQVCPQ